LQKFFLTSLSNANSSLFFKEKEVIKNDSVKNAMLSIDRAFFAPRDPYEDRPQSIGYQTTISAPHMHAYALTFLAEKLKEGSRALDVGSGTGYLTACIAKMVGKSGLTVGIEHIDELVKGSLNNINKCDTKIMKEGNLKILGKKSETFKILLALCLCLLFKNFIS
jgi:protein-L-isoaspartate(D-aspartate) O-methyltransferase